MMNQETPQNPNNSHQNDSQKNSNQNTHAPKNRLFWLIPLVLFTVLLVMMFLRLGHETHVVPDKALNKPLPAFSLPDLLAPDSQMSNADLPTAPFILNVWGSWCPSCYTEHPFIVELAEQGVNFIGVNYQDELADALQYLEKQKNPYSRVIQDYEGKLSLNLGLTGAPESFLVDAQGNIRQHIVGVISPENWKTRIQPCWQALNQDLNNVSQSRAEVDAQVARLCQ